MDLKRFLKSRYYRQAQTPAGAQEVGAGFSRKLKKLAADNPVIVKAKQLYAYFRDPAVPKRNKALIIAGLLYFITPWDALPDFAPGIGYIDDLGVLSMVLAYLNKELASSGARHDKAEKIASPTPVSASNAKDSRRKNPDRAGSSPEPPRERRSVRVRLVGFFLDPYLRDIQQLQEERLAREMEARLKMIKLSLLGLIAAACVSLIYFLLRRYLVPG